ncbi:MAG: hypothetical protein IPH03_03785 [Tetrasphaera sp.]|nr:hypothetical protein [Tetrasphaera sp.]
MTNIEDGLRSAAGGQRQTAMREVSPERVAIIDIDAHHGNGTQAIFTTARSSTVRCMSTRAAGGSRTSAGFADEVGSGAGEGWNRNLPLPRGPGDDAFLAGVAELCAQASALGSRPGGLLGVDAAGSWTWRASAGEPRRFLGRWAPARRDGAADGSGAEGGYHLETLGLLVADVLGGFG